VTFNEVLSQTIAMLHQHGRVSYRALKRQFAIQDDYLEDKPRHNPLYKFGE
jgi:hypothetical protein